VQDFGLPKRFKYMADNINNSKKKQKTGSFIKELLSGSMVSEKLILKNLGYVAFITLLAAIYIGNRFHAEKITRETSSLQKLVKDLRAEALATSANMMYVSRQSEVLRVVKQKGLNLEEMKTPPFKLLVDKK
jgi:Bacteriodetes cell division protein (FtsL-like)